MRDFYLAASRDYKVSTLEWQGVTINSYALQKHQAGSDLVLSVARNALEIYSNEFGPYPYNEIDLVSAPMHGALGMEYSELWRCRLTCIMCWPIRKPAFIWNLLLRTRLPINGSSISLVADQVDEPWLDEGMAQFATAIYYQDRYGASAAEQVRLNWQQRWQRIESQPIPIGLPVSAYLENQYSPIIYGRAPLFIQSLQEKLGRDKFSSFLHAYYQKYQWGITTTAIFRQTMEEICACSLESQFKEWVVPQ